MRSERPREGRELDQGYTACSKEEGRVRMEDSSRFYSSLTALRVDRFSKMGPFGITPSYMDRETEA